MPLTLEVIWHHRDIKLSLGHSNQILRDLPQLLGHVVVLGRRSHLGLLAVNVILARLFRLRNATQWLNVIEAAKSMF